jgi:hypothetical protein
LEALYIEERLSKGASKKILRYVEFVEEELRIEPKGVLPVPTIVIGPGTMAEPFQVVSHPFSLRGASCS